MGDGWHRSQPLIFFSGVASNQPIFQTYLGDKY